MSIVQAFVDFPFLQDKILNTLEKINFLINQYAIEFNQDDHIIALLAVTKNQPPEKIMPLLQMGHRLFGENKVQEAFTKWIKLKELFPNIELHLIGHLQSNKVKEAVALFDVIETLDSIKLAEKLAAAEKKQNKSLRYFIEINIGREPQKNGVWPENFPTFIKEVRQYFSLNIQGVMCIPPKDEDPAGYFQQLQVLAKTHDLPIVSMGMSEDYKTAIQYGSTLVRIGRALFENE